MIVGWTFDGKYKKGRKNQHLADLSKHLSDIPGANRSPGTVSKADLLACADFDRALSVVALTQPSLEGFNAWGRQSRYGSKASIDPVLWRLVVGTSNIRGCSGGSLSLKRESYRAESASRRAWVNLHRRFTRIH